jgi:membrane protein implicated in regulation of membrane protease activity
VTTLTRVLAYGLAAVLVGGFVVLALAGVPAARIIVITALAVVAMIGLGSAFGGRRSSGRPSGRQDAAPGAGDEGGTMGT